MSGPAQPHDRRQSRVTIDQMRRLLREADEDRYRLARQALHSLLHSANPFDRRRPRVSIQDVRRDLREADEDRFRLLMLTRSRPGNKPRTFGLWVILLVGAGFVARTAQAPGEDLDLVGSAAAASSGLGYVTFVHLPDDLPPETAMVFEPAVRVEAAEAQPRAKARRAYRPALYAPPVQEEVPRQARQRNGSDEQDDTERELRRLIPRPLHPGEFGRKLPRTEVLR